MTDQTEISYHLLVSLQKRDTIEMKQIWQKNHFIKK